jgi:hypothetical protein
MVIAGKWIKTLTQMSLLLYLFGLHNPYKNLYNYHILVIKPVNQLRSEL